jgi:predicted NBD/HSP70 family sugar kinase
MLVTVDTGGTKTLIASFGQDGKIGETIKFPTPKNQDEYVATLRDTLQKNYGDQAVEVIVVALPGIVKDGVAVWCNNLGWKNFNALGALADVLSKTPVLIENDANLAGLAETRVLDPMPLSSLYVTVSTGIGTGIITGGKIDPGLRFSEGGRSLVEFDGVVREWESFASGKAIFETYHQYARDITSERTWQQIADRISRGFLAMIPIIQPDVIIIGGSIGAYFDRYGAQLEAILREKLPPHIPCPRVLPAKHPERAVIYGCYYYAIDYLARD